MTAKIVCDETTTTGFASLPREIQLKIIAKTDMWKKQNPMWEEGDDDDIPRYLTWLPKYYLWMEPLSGLVYKDDYKKPCGIYRLPDHLIFFREVEYLKKETCECGLVVREIKLACCDNCGEALDYEDSGDFELCDECNRLDDD